LKRERYLRFGIRARDASAALKALNACMIRKKRVKVKRQLLFRTASNDLLSLPYLLEHKHTCGDANHSFAILQSFHQPSCGDQFLRIPIHSTLPRLAGTLEKASLNYLLNEYEKGSVQVG